MNILVVENVCKSYDSELILNKIDFIFKRGAIYVIQGKSGIGKTTFLSIISGMELPTSGRVRYNNCSLYEQKDEVQAKIRGLDFGFIFQNHQLIPYLTVKENIELPLMINNLLIGRNKIHNLIEELELGQILNKKASVLSGGERQRTSIARAVITNPKIIFADEPTASLDYDSNEKTTNLLVNLCKKHHITLIMVSHQEPILKTEYNLCRFYSDKIIMEKKNV